MHCVHCEKPIKRFQRTFIYPKSRMVAHLVCVSVISAEATDALLVTRKAVNSRLVYSTGFSRRVPRRG